MHKHIFNNLQLSCKTFGPHLRVFINGNSREICLLAGFDFQQYVEMFTVQQ